MYNFSRVYIYCLLRQLLYDWYFPIFLLEDLPIIFEFESASEANSKALELSDDYRIEWI